MNKSIKFLALSLTVIISASFLSGCKSKAVNSTSTKTDNKEISAKVGNPTLPIVSKQTTLKVWMPMDQDYTKTMKNIGESEYYKELEKRTGVHIDFIHPAIGQESASLNLLISSGDYPDIIQTTPNFVEYPGGEDKAISDGVFLKLNDFVKKYAPNYNELINSTEEIRKGTITDSGNIGGFHQICRNVQPAWYGLVVRQDWLDDLGLKTPVTYDDWRTMLKVFKEKKGATNPFMLHNTGFEYANALSAGYGVGSSFYGENGKVKFGPIESGYKEYLTMINEWYTEGLIGKDFTTNKSLNPPINYVATGKAGAWSDLYVLLSSDKQQSNDSNYRAVAVPAPVKKVGDKLHFRQTNTNVTAGIWSITTECKDPINAVKWIDYTFSPEGSLLANYGVKDISYKVGSDSKPQLTELMYKNTEGLTLKQTLRKYVKATSAAFDYDWERELVEQPKDNAEAPSIWGENNDGAATLPQITLTAEEGSEYSAIMGDINTYVSEMSIKFILGQQPLTKYDEFVNQIKSMNIDRAIKIEQTAVDRRNARK